MIRKFRNHPDFVLPDRSQVTMTVPFMDAYTELMVKSCHRRGAHVIGGMAAFVPNRRDEEVTEQAIAAVTSDKKREAEAGCDGTWVAHPDLVPVAREPFNLVLGDSRNQIARQREDVDVSAADLLAFDFPGDITIDGIRTNVSVGIQYLASWLSGTGAVTIDNLMEDLATAEISRSQIWQRVHHQARTFDGIPITSELIRQIVLEFSAMGEDSRVVQASKLFEDVALSEEFVEFASLPAYALLG